MEAEYFVRAKSIPFILRKLAILTRRLLCCFKNKEKNVVKPERIEIDDFNRDDEMYTKLNSKCNFCDRCVECEKEKEKEKEKKREQLVLESNVSALNYIAFVILFLIILVSNLVIWILIST